MTKSNFSLHRSFPLIFTATLLAATSASANTTSPEVARVNGQVITLEQLNQHFDSLAQSRTIPNLTKKLALEDLIKKEAGIAEAKKQNLDRDAIVQERIRTVLFSTLLERKLNDAFQKIVLTDAEVKNWYQRNPEVRISQIFIAIPPGATSEDIKKANNTLSDYQKEILGGRATFAEVAQRSSEDPSAANGGDLDYRIKSQLDPAVYAAAVKIAKPGSMAGPIRGSYGLHLIRLTAKKTWLEANRAEARNLIIDEKRAALVDQYLSEVRKKASVSINQSLIKD